MTSSLSLSKILWRHKTSFCSIFFLGTAASAVLLHSIPMSYESRSILEYPHTAEINKTINNLQSNETFLELVQNLDLLNDPRFTKQITDNPSIKTETQRIRFKSLSFFDEQMLTDTSESRNAALKSIQKIIDITPLDNGKQIQISVKTQDPKLSAHIANTLATLEIERAQSKKNESLKIFSALSEKIDTLQNQLIQTDTEIIETQGKIAKNDLQTQYAHQYTLSSLSEKIQRLNDEKSALETTKVPSHDFIALKTETEKLQAQKLKLANRYGDKHPKMIALHKKIQEATIKLSSLEKNSLDAIDNKRKDIEAELALAEIELASIAPAAGEKQPNPELQNLLTQQKTFRTTIQDLIKQQMQNAKTIRSSSTVPEIVMTATPNQTPVSIPHSTLMAYAMGFFALLGTFPGSIAEIRRRKIFQNTDDLVLVTGRPCFGRIELIEDFEDLPVADYVLSNPQSQISEALKALRIHLKLRNTNSDTGQSVLICSALENEGKSTTALWLARQAAQAGIDTILIDADLRSPSIHKMLHADNTASIVDVLTGRRLLDQCIRKDSKTNLHLILGSPAPNSASDLLSNKSFSVMLSSLRQNYDLIIIDSHSAYTVADSRAIAALVDQIIMTVQWNKTPREIVHNSIEELSSFSTAPIATVLAGIDVEEQAKLNFGDVIYTYENA